MTVHHRRWLALVALLSFVQTVPAAELKRETLQAFERYSRLTEARLDAELREKKPFLWVENLPEARRSEVAAQLRAGQVFIEELKTRDQNGKEIDIPDGMVHHWMGTVFIPGVKLKQVLALIQDYDNHEKYYAPDVVRAKILKRDGDYFKVFFRFLKKKVITVVVDTDHDVRYYSVDPTHAHSRAYTTRVQQVENPGQPEERLKPEGNDSGFLWRLNSFWRFQEKDGGVFVQCEAVTLTRGIPFGVGWLIRPFVTSVPRESLSHTLESTRRALLDRKLRPEPAR